MHHRLSFFLSSLVAAVLAASAWSTFVYAAGGDPRSAHEHEETGSGSEAATWKPKVVRPGRDMSKRETTDTNEDLDGAEALDRSDLVPASVAAQAILFNASMVVLPALSQGTAWVIDAEYQHALDSGWALVIQTIDMTLQVSFEGGNSTTLGLGFYGGVKHSWGDGALDGFYLEAVLGPFLLTSLDGRAVAPGAMGLAGLGYQWIAPGGFTAELGLAVGMGAFLASQPFVFPAGNLEARLGYAW